jgi:hypothetical protein
MDKTLKNRLSLLAGNYIGERSAVLVTADSNVFYIENENKCRNYCVSRKLEYYTITKADVAATQLKDEKPKEVLESDSTIEPKRKRRKRTQKDN